MDHLSLTGEAVEIAKELVPTGDIWQADQKNVDCSQADVVLLSQVLEYADDPFRALDVLKTAQEWVILHKIRVAQGASRKIEEETYAGHTENCFLWNLNELCDALTALGFSLVSTPFKWCQKPGERIVTLCVLEERCGLTFAPFLI